MAEGLLHHERVGDHKRMQQIDEHGHVARDRPGPGGARKQRKEAPNERHRPCADVTLAKIVLNDGPPRKERLVYEKSKATAVTPTKVSAKKPRTAGWAI
eukprot:scaffold127200_cov31-Tisochrysis_lutea.AAC.2